MRLGAANWCSKLGSQPASACTRLSQIKQSNQQLMTCRATAAGAVWLSRLAQGVGATLKWRFMPITEPTAATKDTTLVITVMTCSKRGLT